MSSMVCRKKLPTICLDYNTSTMLHVGVYVDKILHFFYYINIAHLKHTPVGTNFQNNEQQLHLLLHAQKRDI